MHPWQSCKLGACQLRQLQAHLCLVTEPLFSRLPCVDEQYTQTCNVCNRHVPQLHNPVSLHPGMTLSGTSATMSPQPTSEPSSFSPLALLPSALLPLALLPLALLPPALLPPALLLHPLSLALYWMAALISPPLGWWATPHPKMPLLQAPPTTLR